MASMTTLPLRISAGGRPSGVRQGIASRTMSPKRAASSTVAAWAWSPSSATNSLRLSGPRELLMATSCPARVKSLATVAPIMPAPMIPIFGERRFNSLLIRVLSMLLKLGRDGFRGRVLFQKSGQSILARRADNSFRFLTVLEENQRRDALDAIALRSGRVIVNV